MKRFLLTCFLILGLCAPSLLVYHLFLSKKSEIKHEVKEKIIQGLDLKELSLLKFLILDTPSVLRWKHEREFEYEGEMYDVVSSEIIGDSIFYYCWWDHEETRLNKDLKSIISQILLNDLQQQHNTDQYLTFQKSLLFSPIKSPYTDSFDSGNVNTHYNLDYNHSYSFVLYSPPENCVAII